MKTHNIKNQNFLVTECDANDALDIFFEDDDFIENDEYQFVDLVDWSDDWANDIQQELEGEFDEEACIEEVTQIEAMPRPEAMSLNDVLFEMPQLYEEVRDQLRHYID